jgi:hypothetical protein
VVLVQIKIRIKIPKYLTACMKAAKEHLQSPNSDMLVPLVSAYHYDGPEVNTSLAHSEAKILQDKIHDKAYGDEEIIRILTTRSKAQLLATFNSYNDQFIHPINKVNKNYPFPFSNSYLFHQKMKGVASLGEIM